MKPWFVLGWVGPTCAVVTTLVAAQPALPDDAPTAPSLAQLVDLAWAASLEARGARARSQAIEARDRAAGSPFPAPPSVALDLRQGLPASLAPTGTGGTSTAGWMELDTGVAAPLWLPGQQRATRAVVAAEGQRHEAGLALARWLLAGEVREAAWTLDGAQDLAVLQAERQATACALASDVGRRVEAGELAPVDRMLASAECLAAVSSLQEAHLQASKAAARLQRLTGQGRVGDIRETPASAGPIDVHPAVVALKAALGVADARLDLVRATSREAPTVSVVARLERNGLAGEARNSVRLGVAVPLDTEARQTPRLTAAVSEQVDAQWALARERDRLELDRSSARQVVAAQQALQRLASERVAQTRSAVQAIERAFHAGERGLPDVLRAHGGLLDARLAEIALRNESGRAIARLNQTSGVTP